MMATALDLHSLEQYCETLYNPSSQTSRIQVESLLNYHFPTFSFSSTSSSAAAAAADDDTLLKGHSPSINTPIESALFCRSLLENTKNPFALMFATSRLKNLVEDHFTTFTAPEQLGLQPQCAPFYHKGTSTALRHHHQAGMA
ncbi:MAG: hypothetical protein J3Q66DRAFT_19688 [Benniella sp.]|nr:MAG: hypothetical protein J3Q66DRAFT_19688 [Benniella sp.]